MSLAKHTIYNIVGGVIPAIGALVTVPIYVHLIGPARYGVLAIAWILLGYFGLFDLGLGRATSFRIAALVGAEPRDRADTFWAAVCVNLVMGLIGGALLWGAAGYFFAHVFKVDEALRPEMIAAVPWLAMSVPVATLTGVLTGGMQGREKFLGINVVSVISSTFFQIFPLVVTWLMGANLVWILAAALSARLAALAVLAYFCHVELVRGHPIRLKREEVPLLLKYGGWVSVAAMLAPFLTVVDRFVIGATVGAVGVAVYTIPFQLTRQIAVIPGALNTAFFPRLAAASPEQRKILEREALLTISSLVTLPVLGGIFLAEEVLRLWVGHKLGAEAAPIARILFLTFWFNGLALVPYTNLEASGRPDLVVKFQLAETIPYFIALYVGLKWFGIEGAALAFLFRMILDYGGLSWANGRRFPAIGVIATSLVILLLGDLAASTWSITAWQWWATAVVLGLASLAISWRTLPERVRREVTRLLGASNSLATS